MKDEFAYETAQRHLGQRNRFAALSAVLGLTSLLAIGAAATRDEAVVLVPITSETLVLSSGGVEAHYLELVTRDTALIRSLKRSGTEYSEIYLKGPETEAVGRLVLDPLSATIFSSDPDTYAAIHAHVENGMPLERAVALVAGLEGGA